ncbi:MAG: hypothetical protein KAI79_19200 [Bacteroidales bacterium]|nr:hypothetical protein [Bacteroidales bacterium]
MTLSIVASSVLLSTLSVNLQADFMDMFKDMKEAASAMSKSAKEDTLEVKVKKESLTFDILYPISFYKTGVFKWGTIAVVSVGVAAATVYTGGAAGVPGATLLGGIIGGGGAGAWAAGLATLGGGTLASGGLGIAGGALVVATMTDVTIAGLASFAVPENHTEGRKYNIIKIPLPKIGSKQTLTTYEQIEELTKKFMDGEIKSDLYEEQSYSYYKHALANLSTHKSTYDLINGAILAYNLGAFEKSQEYLNKAKNIFGRKSSFIDYMQALLYLVSNDNVNALNELNAAIQIESDVLTPYLLKIQIQIDNEQVSEAKKTVKEGLENYDDDNFQLNYLGGILSYRQHSYKEAIEFFEDALSNITINEVEAETKMLIAKCYKNLNDSKKQRKWYKDSLSEIDDDSDKNKKYRTYLKTMFNNED